MISTYEQQLRKFKSRPPCKLISVQINKEQYQLQVNEGHTIKDIVQRYLRSGHLSSQFHQQVQLNGELLVDSKTVGELTKLMEDKKMKQLSIKIKQLPKQQKKIKNQSQQQAQQPLQQACSVADVNVNININKKRQPIEAEQQQNKINKTIKWLNAVINNNPFQLAIEKYAEEDEKKIFNLILKIQQQIITKYQISQDFSNVLFEKLGKLRENEEFNGFRKKKSKRNVGSQISMFGDKQNNIIQTIQTLLSYIQTHKSTHNESKLQKTISLMQETSLAQIKQIQQLKKQKREQEQKIKQSEQERQKLERQIQRLKKQIQKLKKQIQKLEQININKSLGSTTINSTHLQNTTVWNSNCKNQIKLITSYVNRIQYQDQFAFLLACLHQYQARLVDTIQPLATFTNNLYFDSLPLLFDTLNLNSPNTRIIIILQTSSGQFLAFYSTNGIQKMIKQSPPGSPMKSKSSISEQQAKLQPCENGLGFLVQLKQRKQFSLPKHEDMKSMMWYDQKFLYITQSLRIFKNLNKKLQLQLRTAQVQEIWGQDMGNSLAKELNKLKKASEIKRMEVLKVNLSVTQTYQAGDASSQSCLINKVNLLLQKM